VLIKANGVSLHVEDQGAGAAVILLHGWPDSSHLWRRQLPVLAASGYRALAPDLRGFGRSDRPPARDAYLPHQLIGDVLGLMDRLDIDRAHIVGHGWGAFIAWTLAMEAPDRVGKLVTLGIAHPGAPRVNEVIEYERAWYQWFFLFEDVAEQWLMHDDWKLFRQFLHDSPDTERSIADLSGPGALAASLNLFRANMQPSPPRSVKSYPRVSAPVLAIWATGDGGKGLSERRLLSSRQFVDGPWRYERIEAGHWLPTIEADRVNDLLLAWFATP
jgi:pimeloyl-ACP methyl ester carboxylesterase